MYAHLLNCSAKYSKKLSRQSIKHNNNEFSSVRMELTISRVACMMATIKDPKQMGPKDVVILLQYEFRTADEQHDFASPGINHQVPTVPATVQCTTFLIT
mmetsp:Transcript_47096/g.53392  ORF Transcript_47096/g.53392 Transcript_47096/m.53392 type:complete len:100 (+) Transcript_47096:287-586(+)